MMTISGVETCRAQAAVGSEVELSGRARLGDRNVWSREVRLRPQDLTALSVVENGIETATD